MRALLQRVSSATVRVDGELIGAIERGLCCYVGVTHADNTATARRLAERIWGLRIFEDDNGQINQSAEELHLGVLVVSQFTLYADATRGRRPSFVNAAPPEQAAPRIEELVSALEQLGARVAKGRFGAAMAVEIANDGPFTLLLEV
jgi:D-tyrosyl-tRNA(Tyr) deacylase